VYTNHENVWELEYVFPIYFMGVKEMFTTMGPNVLIMQMVLKNKWLCDVKVMQQVKYK